MLRFLPSWVDLGSISCGPTSRRLKVADLTLPEGADTLWVRVAQLGGTSPWPFGYGLLSFQSDGGRELGTIKVYGHQEGETYRLTTGLVPQHRAGALWFEPRSYNLKWLETSGATWELSFLAHGVSVGGGGGGGGGGQLPLPPGPVSDVITDVEQLSPNQYVTGVQNFLGVQFAPREVSAWYQQWTDQSFGTGGWITITLPGPALSGAWQFYGGCDNSDKGFVHVGGTPISGSCPTLPVTYSGAVKSWGMGQHYTDRDYEKVRYYATVFNGRLIDSNSFPRLTLENKGVSTFSPGDLVYELLPDNSEGTGSGYVASVDPTAGKILIQCGWGAWQVGSRIAKERAAP